MNSIDNTHLKYSEAAEANLVSATAVVEEMVSFTNVMLAAIVSNWKRKFKSISGSG